jgi:hypothetical protein
MTQPQRPISRSSTPIEFTPLILDLEPEVKEEPKKKHGGTFLLMMVVGIAIVLGALSYLGLKKSDIDGQTTIVSPNTKTTGIMSTASVSPDEKRRIFSHGITNAKLILENIDGQDVLKVSIQDKAGEGITWVYEWTKNNQIFSRGDSTKDFKRGDNVAVKIMPFDGEKYGNPKILTTEIKNTTPRVVEDKAATFDGKQFSYQVKATDADGDGLTYSLMEGPPGATIDQKTGIITCLSVPEDQQKLDLKVKISDGHNGEIIYPVTVNFSKVTNDKLTAKSK